MIGAPAARHGRIVLVWCCEVLPSGWLFLSNQRRAKLCRNLARQRQDREVGAAAKVVIPGMAEVW